MSNLNLVTRTAMSNTAVSVLEAEGVLDINTVGDFETALDRFFKNKQYKIVLNLEKLRYISSAGIGVLVGNIKEVRKNHGDIKLSSVNPEIYKVFDLLDLPAVFHFHKNERDAAAAF
jgi:anti-sigma B factor antagonist